VVNVFFKIVFCTEPASMSTGYYKQETPYGIREPPVRTDDGKSKRLFSPVSIYYLCTA